MTKDVGEYSGEAAGAPVSTTNLRYNRDNFMVWATTMEWTLESNELWEAVDPGGDEYKKVIRPKRIYFLEHFCYCFSSNLSVLNATNTD
jgi:hypothetical protein